VLEAASYGELREQNESSMVPLPCVAMLAWIPDPDSEGALWDPARRALSVLEAASYGELREQNESSMVPLPCVAMLAKVANEDPPMAALRDWRKAAWLILRSSTTASASSIMPLNWPYSSSSCVERKGW